LNALRFSFKEQSSFSSFASFKFILYFSNKYSFKNSLNEFFLVLIDSLFKCGNSSSIKEPFFSKNNCCAEIAK
jgi:hypothetical protein